MGKFERAVRALGITVVQINILSSANGGSATLQRMWRPAAGTRADAAVIAGPPKTRAWSA